MVSGYVAAKIIIEDDQRLSLREKLFDFVGVLQVGLSLVLKSIVAKRQGTEPVFLSTKIAFFVLAFAGFLIFTLYRSGLAAFIVAEKDNPPIGSLKELLDSDYNLAVMEGSALTTMFCNAPRQSDEYQLYKNGKIVWYTGAPELPGGYIDSMVDKSSPASQTILVDLYEIIKLNEHYPCTLSEIKTIKRKPVPSTIMFQKNWPFEDFFNYHLLRMKESGLLELLHQRNTNEPNTYCFNERIINRVVKAPRSMDVAKTFSLYVVFLIGLGLSIIFFLLEKLSRRALQVVPP